MLELKTRICSMPSSTRVSRRHAPTAESTMPRSRLRDSFPMRLGIGVHIDSDRFAIVYRCRRYMVVQIVWALKLNRNLNRYRFCPLQLIALTVPRVAIGHMGIERDFRIEFQDNLVIAQ